MIWYELISVDYTNLVNVQGSTELLSEKEFIMDWRGSDWGAAVNGGEQTPASDRVEPINWQLS